MRKARSLTCLILILAMILALLPACSGKTEATDISITISYEGEEAAKLEFLYGETQTFELDAEISGASEDSEVTWSSSDAGVIRITESSSTSCTASILKSGSAKVSVECEGCKQTISITVDKNQDVLRSDEVALTINGEDYSVEKINMIVAIMYNQFLSSYGSYASYYGLDTSEGLAGLADQECDYSSDGTWLGYFVEESISNIEEMAVLKAYAEENDISLGESELQDISDTIETFEEDAAESGYESADSYAAANLGSGATTALYEWYLEFSAIASKAYDAYYESLEYTEDEIREHYLEMGYEDDGENDYNMVSMRHILIMAEADENGEYTDEAIAAAHERAEEIYEEWLSGDADEESFAELANEYSEDTGSNTNGGLYENIYKDNLVEEINDFVFGERSYGDTAVLDHFGSSYAGTHIVFFVGECGLYSDYLSSEDLRSDATEEWLSGLLEDIELTEGAAYDNIGKFN